MAHLQQALGTRTALLAAKSNRLLPLVASCYPSVILALATFLFALLCCQTAPPEYQAEAVILHDAGDLDAPTGDIESWLKSDAVLRATLTNAQWPHLTEGAAPAERTRQIAELRERLVITTLHQPDESPRLAIACTAPRGSVALNLSQELARQVAEHFEIQRQEIGRRQSEEQLAQVHEQLRLARDAEERQRGELERLRHGQLAMTVAGSRGQGSPPTSGETERLNPRWVELKKQLDSLQNQRTEMLEVLQESHPEISGLDLRIAKVSGSLGKTPRQLAVPIEPISQGVTSAAHRKSLVEWRRENPAIAQQQFQQEALPAESTRQGLDPFLNMAAQIDEADHQLTVLTSQRKGLEWDQAALEQSLDELPAAGESPWRTEPARRIAKIGGGYTAQQLGWGSIASLAVAGVVLLSQWRVLAGKRLASLADVLIHVRLPLTGAVELAAEHDPWSSFRLGTTPLRLATRCGEALILGIVFTCLSSSWLDPTLATEFGLDPLGAYAETARRIL